MSITDLTTVTQLNEILGKSKDKLSVIDFHAIWCGPCKMIEPTYVDLARQYPNVNFLKCDVDEAKPIANLYSISAMPTFIFLKGSTKVDQVRGPNRTALQQALRTHSTGSPLSGAFSGKGQTLGGRSSPQSSMATLPSMKPELSLLLALTGAYFVFWYLS